MTKAIGQIQWDKSNLTNTMWQTKSDKYNGTNVIDRLKVPKFIKMHVMKQMKWNVDQLNGSMGHMEVIANMILLDRQDRQIGYTER